MPDNRGTIMRGCRMQRQRYHKRSTALPFLAALSITLLCLVSCESRKPPLRIGLSVNLSGRGGTAGEYIRDGAMLAVEEINQRGGVNGRPLQLLVRDDGNTDEGVMKADKSLIHEEVVAIIGHTHSDSTLKAYPYVTSHNTLLFTSYTATTLLTGKDDLFFRTSVDTQVYGAALGKLLARKKVRTVAFLMDMSNPSFATEYVEETRKHFSGTVVTVPFDYRKRPDMDTVLPGLTKAAPQAVILLTEVSMTGIAAQKLRAKGFRGDLIATLWAQTPDLLRYGGSAVEGMTLLTFIDPENKRPDYLAFSERIREKFKAEVSARTDRAYEAVCILAEALKKCPTPTAAELKAALLSMEFVTLMGPVRFDRYGDVIRPVYEVQIQEGRFRNRGEIQ